MPDSSSPLNVNDPNAQTQREIEEENLIEASQDGMPAISITFVTDEGPIVALPYLQLQACTLDADLTSIMAYFGEICAVVVGDDLSDVHSEIANHLITRIQAAGHIKSVSVCLFDEEEKQETEGGEQESQ